VARANILLATYNLIASQAGTPTVAKNATVDPVPNTVQKMHSRQPEPARARVPVAAKRAATADVCPVAVERSVRYDIELARIALGLTQSPQFQRYLALHDHARETGRQGFTYAEFYALMDAYGIQGTHAYHARMLRKGRGMYWNIANGMIYPAGYVNLAHRLVQIAHDTGLHDLYASGNHPGQRRAMYIRVNGTAADFEGAILASWYHAHNCPTISRYTLSALFNRDRRSLYHMERLAGVTVIYNEAETTDPAQVPLNDEQTDIRGDVYQTTNKQTGEIIYHFRLANTYQTSMIRQHSRRGQTRRAAYTFKQWFDSIQLHTSSEGEVADNFSDLVKLNRSGRIYCADDKAAKRSRKRGNVGQLYIRWRPGRGSGIVWRVSDI